MRYQLTTSTLGRTLAVLLAICVVCILAAPLAFAAANVSQNKDAVAVIIGNKDYAGSVPDVDFAHNDAEAMKRFVIEVLGFREGNVILVRNATKGRLETLFGTASNPKGQLFDWVRADRSDVVVFYSGHGAPGLDDRRGYLVPVDADPNRMELGGYPIDQLYNNLAQLSSRSTTVFLDACFSGNSPKGMIIRSASPIGLSAVPERAASGLTVLTAASGGQLANWDEEAEHGLFTRYLLDGLRGKADGDGYGDGNGEVTLAEVRRYLDEEMTYQSRRRFGVSREQRASAIGASEIVLASVSHEPPPSPKDFRVADADLTMRTLKNANVRSGPSAAEEKLTTLPSGSAVTVTGEVEGRDWYRVALVDGGEGYVWRPLLGEEKATPAEPVEVATEPEPSPPPPIDPLEIVIASGPLRGLMLADWLLLSADRLQDKEYAALIGEAVELRQQHGRIGKVEAILQRAVMGDLAAKTGMARVVYAAAYRRQHGSFTELESYLNGAVGEALSSLEPISESNASAALAALGELKPVSGVTLATLSLEARAYHVLEDYSKAEAAYGAWLNAAQPVDDKRKIMISAMLRARKHEPFGPSFGETFRDCADCPEMIVVPAGEFMMGSPESEAGRYSDEGPLHRVSVRQPFAIGKYEVTFAEWDACVAGGGCNGYQPYDKGWGRGSRPVINVSYEDAKSYTAWLSRETGHAYRLPSEAEWEYAARAGTDTPFHSGETINIDLANYDGNFIYGGGSKGIYRKQTVAVGSFPPNSFGLHDVHGNVREWVEDCWNNSYVGAPSYSYIRTVGDCRRRVLRGGSWGSEPRNVRSAIHSGYVIEFRNYGIGFRIARTLK
jgi:formylglycine-generating enzyme required for sulfatase activity